MRIDKIEGYDFPITIVCDNAGCGITFTVTMPTDMRRKGIWKSKLVDNVHQPSKVGERLLTKCPCCGDDYPIDARRIPRNLYTQVPYDRTGDPVVGHC